MRSEPGTPSIGFISSLATRAGEFTTPRVKEGSSPPRTRSRAAKWLTSSRLPSHRLTLPRWGRADLAACPFPKGEDACHRLLQLQFTTRAPARTFDSRGVARAFTRTARPLEPKPQRTTRVARRLTAPMASFGRLDHAPSVIRRRSRASCVPGGVSRSMTPRTTPLRRGLVSARTRRKSRTSDAPCRGAPEPKPLKHRQNRFPRPLVKRTGFHGSKRLLSTGVHSPNAFAPGSNADPPPFLELGRSRPASDALSPFARERKG